jgi:endonuclease-8
MVAGIRREPPNRRIGDALLDQRLVAGIGNIWKVESLWIERVSPWRPLADVSDDELRAVLAAAQTVMRARVEGVPYRANIYRRKRHMCPRCGTPIKAWPQGDDARMTYWCPQCQRGEEPKTP